MKFKDNAKSVNSADVYYDLFEGGYIKPEDWLEDSLDLQNVRFAIETLDQFLSEAEDRGLIEEY